MLSAEWVGIVVSAVMGSIALVIAAISTATGRKALKLAREIDARYEIPWKLTHRSGDLYRLANTGNETAYAVVIEGPIVHHSRSEHDKVDPHSSAEFLTSPRLNAPTGDVVVTWHRQEDWSDDQQTWSHPLPPKPR